MLGTVANLSSNAISLLAKGEPGPLLALRLSADGRSIGYYPRVPPPRTNRAFEDSYTLEPINLIAVNELAADGCVLVGDLAAGGLREGERFIEVTALGHLFVTALKREPLASVMAATATGASP